MQILYADEFEKDIKKLQKKYRSIFQDLESLKKVIIGNPTGKGVSKHWNELSGIQDKPEHITFYKVRMMCRSLRSSDLRVVYCFNGTELQLLFIEMYFKGDREIEDKKRINDILKRL